MASNNMTVEERLALIKRNTMEVVSEEELRTVLETKEQPLAYIGFEPSGIVHMGWALVTAKIKDLCDAGFKVIILWADWHAAINDKVGGDLENIRAVARYMEDCFVALGVPRDKVEFKYAQDVVNDLSYWSDILKVGKITSLSRIKRTMTIMGRKEDEAELGYWIGVPSWGRGLVPEAAREMLRHAFEDLGLARVWCGYYDGNEKSKRVQEKLGYTHQWTTEDVPVPQMGETRRGYVNLLTKEEWLSGLKTE